MQRVRTAEDLDQIRFDDGVAALEVAPALLTHLAFRNDERLDSPRLRRVIRSIRDHGYQPTDPIIARVGRLGRWVVIDGGHRITALREILGSLWTPLIGPKIGPIYFLLFEGPGSWAKLGGRPEIAPEAPSEPSAPRSIM